MRILVLALSGIGDALMFTPSLKLLKKDIPNVKIDALVMYSGARDLYNRLECIDNVIFFDFMKEGRLRSLKFVLSLRNQYDSTINVYPSNRREYNLISFIIGAQSRAGVRYLRNDLSNLGFLNNFTIHENDNLHNVEQNVNLTGLLTKKTYTEFSELEFPLTSDDIMAANSYLANNNISGQDLCIGFHAGCSTLKNHINRRWETEKFAELARLLIKNHNAKIFIFGGPDENDLKTKIQTLIGSQETFIVNVKNLAQSAAVMRRMNIFVTNDSSLMHVASALRLNVVAIIGPTNTNYIRPWKTEHRIASLNLDCSPCFYYSPKPLTCSRKDKQFKCIKDLQVEHVYNEVKLFLK